MPTANGVGVQEALPHCDPLLGNLTVLLGFPERVGVSCCRPPRTRPVCILVSRSQQFRKRPKGIGPLDQQGVHGVGDAGNRGARRPSIDHHCGARKPRPANTGVGRWRRHPEAIVHGVFIPDTMPKFGPQPPIATALSKEFGARSRKFWQGRK